jgi:glycosyltransferase involved in cell wall biosynthesis
MKKISLIMGTLGRTAELERFLASLDRQTVRDFELFIADQNCDDRLVRVIETYRSRFSIIQSRSARGLSRARNSVLAQASGEIIGFPDDDCWYRPDLLERVGRFLDATPTAAGVSGNCIDESGRILRRGPRTSGWITRNNLFHRVHSFAIFFRRGLIERVGNFDDQLGVGCGTPWGSAEDHDYAARALAAGLKIYYDASLGVCHPDAPHVFDEREIEKEISYARGQGRHLRKNGYSRSYLAYRVVRSLAGAGIGILRLDSGKVRYHWTAALGKLEGWRSISSLEGSSVAPALPGLSRKD